MARKNLTGYDQMTPKNRRMVELYELFVASHEWQKSFWRNKNNDLQEKKLFERQHVFCSF